MHYEFDRHPDGSVAGDLARGAIAGLVATWVMGQVTSYLYQEESDEARQAEDEARGGKTAYGVAAEKSAEAVGRQLTKEERKQAGAAIHWVLGAGAGVAYAAARGRIPGADLGGGLLFGAGFWAAIDEGANTVLGFTPPPTAFPWQTHGRGLAGHLVFGVVAEATLRALDRVA